MTQCDPTPGAANTCPSGYHCAADGFCDALCTPGGNECGDGYTCTPDGRCKGDNECTGLECNVVNCVGQGKPDTTIRGTVYAPNGTLPLYGIKVYVPNAAVPPISDGAECTRCVNDDQLPGSPVNGVAATTDEAGNFTLAGVPSGQNIPLVITSGKWRRQITIPAVAECTDTNLGAAETRLPKNRTEGDMPRIALTTGNADSLECLLRRIGIDDAEIGTNGDDRRVHLYAGNGPSSFTNGFGGGSGAIPIATDFWNDVNKLKPYDIVILSCEGSQRSQTKPQAALDAMKAYADLGGRVFSSHWHNIWIGGNWNENNPPTVAPGVWPQVAQWENASNPQNPIDIIDEVNNPKGSAFATWMMNVMGSTIRGEIPITNGRNTVVSIDNARAERWTYLKSNMRPQNFQFTTPNEAPLENRCGKVVFSDMHVSGNGSTSAYPTGCGDYPTPRELTPQEKALAFMLFDLASCVGVLL